MATSSFNKSFIVKDEKAMDRLLNALDNPKHIEKVSSFSDEDIKKGEEQLIKYLFHLDE